MAKANEEFTFFWQRASPFSQWHKSIFTVDGITFDCAEQYMMYQKAGENDDTSDVMVGMVELISLPSIRSAIFV